MASREAREAANERAVKQDLSATPISRARMDLLWLPPHVLHAFQQALAAGQQLNVSSRTGSAEDDLLYGRINQHSARGEISGADLEWALQVDAIAAQAQDLGNGDMLAESISKWREALAHAPGCDLYLMSMGATFGGLDMHEVALRYLKRAAEINPQSPRIARNLDACRSYL